MCWPDIGALKYVVDREGGSKDPRSPLIDVNRRREGSRSDSKVGSSEEIGQSGGHRIFFSCGSNSKCAISQNGTQHEFLFEQG